MEEHPTTEDFARFLQRSPQPAHAERNALVVRHLLAGCAACHRTIRETEGLPELLELLLEIPLQAKGESLRSSNYDWAFAKTERALTSFLAKGWPSNQLPERLAGLEGLSEGEQLRRVGRESRFADLEFIRCLIERSHGARYQSPRKTLHLARLAHVAADALTAEKAGGETVLADLRAQAWGQFGNALRIANRPREAADAFNTAQCFLMAGTGDPMLRASLDEKMAPFAIFQNRFVDALMMTEEAGAIYERYGEKQSLARTLVQKAIAQLYSGNAEEAVTTLNRALPLISSEEDPYLLLAAQHNLSRCYIDLDRPEEALALYFEARDLYRTCEDPLIILRATWQEGQLLREIGHLHNAETALLRARKGLMEQGLAYEAALVSLDLAEVHRKLGDPEMVRRVISEAIPIFRALRIDREVLASVLQLQRSGKPPEIP